MKTFSMSSGLPALGLALSALTHAPAHAQDAAAGKAVFAQCQACHSVDGTNGAGPSLKGVAGRKAGTFSGFRYSRAMTGAGVNWDPKALDAFIAEPQKVVPGTVMPFGGMPDASQRASLVAYLQTLK
jgi:cytochrome c